MFFQKGKYSKISQYRGIALLKDFIYFAGNIFWEVLMWSMKGWHWQFPKNTDKVLNDLLWIEIQVHIYCSHDLWST